MKKVKYGIILFIILYCTLSSINAISQDSMSVKTPDTANVDSIASAQQGDEFQLDTGKRGFSIQTMLELFRLARGIGYLLVIVFVLGILFVFQKWYVLIRESNDAQKIPVEKLKTMSYDDIKKMFTNVKDNRVISIDDLEKQDESIPLLKRIFRRKKATAFQLLHKLYKIFDAQKTTISFNEETSSFIQYLKDIFNPFMTRLSFLSDTAGALGLLGTVWGMFLVFYKSSPDPEDTLQGMGIALATTIIGLVISIILNSFTTVVSNLFDKHLDFINNMADVFHDRLMREEEKQPIKPQPIIVDSIAMANRVKTQPAIAESQTTEMDEKEKQEIAASEMRKPVYGPPSEVKIISGDNQSAEVNAELPEPIVVEILDADDNPLENETVILTAEDGAGMFQNNSRIQKILTDEEGRVQAKFTLGRTAGEKTIHIVAEGGKNRGVKLLAIAKPTPPAKMIELKGNFQTGELGKRLPVPFTVAIRDRFDNPIPRYEIDFSLKKGSGRFQESQNSHFKIFTNENGLAEVFFIIGNERGAREIEAEAKKVDPSKITFEAFAT